MAVAVVCFFFLDFRGIFIYWGFWFDIMYDRIISIG